MKNNKLVFWSVTVALAGFLFGFDTIVINGAEQDLQAMWSEYTLFGRNGLFHGTIVVGSALWGTVLGAMLGAIPNDRIGRKKTLFLIGVLYTISALGSAIVSDPFTFAFFRFLGGLGVGASTIAAPAFVSEIAPANKRGRLVALYQLNIVVGILVAFVSNYLIAISIEADAWRWMIGIEALPALIYTLVILRVPESPRWLMLKKQNETEARKIFGMIYSEEQIDIEISQIKHSVGTSQTTAEKLFSRKYKFPLFLAFAIAFFNQFSGINALLYYARRIFSEAGLGEDAVFLSTIGIGIANLIFTLLGVMLIDRLGRKQLMYIGSVGYILTLSCTSMAFLFDWPNVVPPALFLFIGAHAIGQGAIIWVFISEIFPTMHRSKGQAFGTSVHWWLAAIIPSLVPTLMVDLGASWMFGFFAFMMVLQLLFTWKLMPETKGKSLEELEDLLIKKQA